MWILICSRALFLYQFQPSMTKNADRNPRILIGQRDLSSGGFSLKSTLDLRYPCAAHGHPTTYFYKRTVRRSKYLPNSKAQDRLKFLDDWVIHLICSEFFYNFRFFFMHLYIRQANFTTTSRFEIVHFHFANFQGNVDKIPIWNKSANANESCQWNCLPYVNMQKEDRFKSLAISFPARRSHGLLRMIFIRSIYASVPTHTITQKLITFVNYRLLVVCPWKWW